MSNKKLEKIYFKTHTKTINFEYIFSLIFIWTVNYIVIGFHTICHRCHIYTYFVLCLYTLICILMYLYYIHIHMHFLFILHGECVCIVVLISHLSMEKIILCFNINWIIKSVSGLTDGRKKEFRFEMRKYKIQSSF